MIKLLAFIGFVAMNSSADVRHLDAQQLYCTAKAVYHESRGESVTGQIAVAWTIRNRVVSDDFPDTPCDVVYQRKPTEQFTGIREVKVNYDSPEWSRAVEASVFTWLDFVDDPTKGARYYYNPQKADKPSWAQVNVKTKIDNHVFWDHP